MVFLHVLLFLIVILGILLIGFCSLFYYFCYYKKKYVNFEKKFNKYSMFEDDGIDHTLADYDSAAY